MKTNVNFIDYFLRESSRFVRFRYYRKSIYLFSYISVYLSIIYLSIYLYIYLYIYIYIYLTNYLSVCLPVCLFVCLPTYLSIYLSIYLYGIRGAQWFGGREEGEVEVRLFTGTVFFSGIILRARKRKTR